MKEPRKVSREYSFSQKAFADLQQWIKEDAEMAEKITDFVEECTRTPFTGRGKPEPLKHGEYKTYWSRRLADDHRLIYKVDDNYVYVVSCHGHYKDK